MKKTLHFVHEKWFKVQYVKRKKCKSWWIKITLFSSFTMCVVGVRVPKWYKVFEVGWFWLGNSGWRATIHCLRNTHLCCPRNHSRVRVWSIHCFVFISSKVILLWKHEYLCLMAFKMLKDECFWLCLSIRSLLQLRAKGGHLGSWSDYLHPPLWLPTFPQVTLDKTCSVLHVKVSMKQYLK